MELLTLKYKKKKEMKKLILAAAALALLTACNSTTETETPISDSIFEKLDSVTPLDSSKVIDTLILDTTKIN